jgi:hypothetical protein
VRRDGRVTVELSDNGAASYTGTQGALLAAGVARPEWFRYVGAPFSARRVRRSFHAVDLEGRVTLREQRDGRFWLSIEARPAEANEMREETRGPVSRALAAYAERSCPPSAVAARCRADRAFQRFLRAAAGAPGRALRRRLESYTACSTPDRAQQP